MGGHRTTYDVGFWIENTGPYSQCVEMADDELTQLDLKLARAEHTGKIYDVAIDPVGDPISFAEYLRGAEILKETSDAG
jgi:hypothetical protein